MAKVLYPVEDAQVHRHSSIDQFNGFLSTYKQGGWAPIVFDQLDGINCETIKSHPVILVLAMILAIYSRKHIAITAPTSLFILTRKE